MYDITRVISNIDNPNEIYNYLTSLSIPYLKSHGHYPIRYALKTISSLKDDNKQISYDITFKIYLVLYSINIC